MLLSLKVESVAKDHFVDHKFESEVELDCLVAGYLHEGEDAVAFGSHVVATQVADVFEDSKQLPQEVYDVVHQLEVEELLGPVPDGYFGSMDVVGLSRVVPPVVDNSYLIEVL